MKILNAFKDFKKKLINKFSVNRNGIYKNRKPILHNQYNDEKVDGLFSDGMSMITATEIIKERINEDLISEYGIGELKNTGRYYIARVSESNGNVVHTLLVDKQNGMVRLLHRKASKTSLK
jgi:hypothetical protein